MQYRLLFEHVLQPIARSASQMDATDLFIPTTPAKESHDLLNFDPEQTKESLRGPSWTFIKDRPLETCYDVLCDSQTFQVNI